MYFAYVHSFALQKSSETDNYGMSMEFYGDYISKCHIIMNKRTPVPGYRLLPSPSTKLKLKDNHYDTPCSFFICNLITCYTPLKITSSENT